MIRDGSAKKRGIALGAVVVVGSLVFWVLFKTNISRFRPGAGQPKFLAPIVTMVEVNSDRYYLPVYTLEKPGIFIEYMDGVDTDSLNFPPVPLWVGKEVKQRLASIPVDVSLYKGSPIVNNEMLEQFIAEGGKTWSEVEDLKVRTGPEFNINQKVDFALGFDQWIVNPKIEQQTHKYLGGDAMVVPNQVVKDTGFSLQGTAVYRFRGRPLIEQEWTEIDLFTAKSKAWLVYDDDYVVFWDYPYFERRGWFGKPTYRFYVVKVPKDDPTWFDPAWLKEELKNLPERIEKERENLNPMWEETRKYYEQLKEIEQNMLKKKKEPRGGN